MFEVAEQALTNGTGQRGAVPAEQAAAAALFPRETGGAHETVGAPRNVATEPHRAHSAVAVEPVGVALATDGEPARPVAVKRAPQARREAPRDTQRLEAVLAGNVLHAADPGERAGAGSRSGTKHGGRRLHAAQHNSLK